MFVSGQKCVLDSIFGISAISQKLESGPIERRQTLRKDLLHRASCAVAVNNADERFTSDRWRRFMHAFASGESARHVAFQLRATLLSRIISRIHSALNAERSCEFAAPPWDGQVSTFRLGGSHSHGLAFGGKRDIYQRPYHSSSGCRRAS